MIELFNNIFVLGLIIGFIAGVVIATTIALISFKFKE